MEFELGQTYSGYQFLDVVRRSRGAVQYRVQNTLAQRVESLHALTSAAADDPDAAERFLREVRIRARISHPHIVTFYTAAPIEGRMAMTTELPDSLSLAERLKLGPLPWREALDTTRQLLDALACIHQQSFVHCDITPENILFGPGGCCKLADFSLARPLDPAHNSESGAVVGNPRYISPEQVKGECHLDQRSDLYSLGVVLYEMLCGRPPFESRSQFELMMAHVNQSPAPPSRLHAMLPQFLDAVVLKALAKDAGDRYPSAAAFADAIAQIAGRESLEPEPPAAASAGVVRSAPAHMAPEAAPAPPATSIPSSVPPPQVAALLAEAVAPPVCPIVPEPAVSAESAPMIAAAEAPEAAPSPAIVPALEAVPEPAPAIADAAAPSAVAPAPEVAPETALASAIVSELDAVPDAAEPPLAIVPELEVIPEPVLAIADAATMPEAATVPTPEAAPEAAATIAEVAEPTSATVPELEAVPEAAAPPSATVAEPEAAPEAAAAPAIVAELAAAPELAPAIADAAAAPDPASEPETSPPAALPPGEAAVIAAAAEPAPAVAPPDALHNTLWAAAAMVAEAASTHPAPPSPAAPPPLPLAALPPSPDPVPAPPPAPQPAPAPVAIPAFMTNLRHAPDSLQWAFFGGTAAFLGIVWAAIWFAAGK